MRSGCFSFAVLLVLAALPVAAGPPKPKAAFFPLAGDAAEPLRERAAFALRAKLDRTGVYDVIDGHRMKELADTVDGPVGLDTPVARLREAAALEEATVILWGELVNSGTESRLRVRILDLRDPAAEPRLIEKTIRQPTDLRFAAEQILETLPGIARFEHPSEEAVRQDPAADELWKTNPNLVVNGGFDKAGNWAALLETQKYPPPLSDEPPAVDKVVIRRLVENGAVNPVLAMRLSGATAAGPGLQCISEPIPIAEHRRYRLSFRYKSDGPRLHVFVKGYTMEKDIRGERVEREIYRRQVPPSGPTGNEWVTVVDELNPQHVAFPVLHLRVALYAYLGAGEVMFDDVVLKEVGPQNRKAVDEAIDRPRQMPATTRQIR